jgi:hypothetical protein
MAGREGEAWFERLQQVLNALPRFQKPRFSAFAPPPDFDELVTRLSAQADAGPDAFVTEVSRAGESANGDALRHAAAIVLEHHPKLQ